jgi:hypothetical protein
VFDDMVTPDRGAFVFMKQGEPDKILSFFLDIRFSYILCCFPRRRPKVLSALRERINPRVVLGHEGIARLMLLTK